MAAKENPTAFEHVRAAVDAYGKPPLIEGRVS